MTETSKRMPGTPCPHCGKSVLSYARFFLLVRPLRPRPCPHCGYAIRLDRLYWSLTAVLAIPAAGLGYYFGFLGISLGLAQVLLVAGLTVFVWVLLFSLLAWKSVPWVAAEAVAMSDQQPPV